MKFGMLFVLISGLALFHLGCGSGGGDSFPTCSGTFKACGGDLTGKWAIDGICFEGDLRSVISKMTADAPPECSDMYQGLSAHISGTVEFANGTQTSDVESTIDMTLRYTSACASAVNKRTIIMSQPLCDMLPSSMKPNKQDGKDVTVKCSFSGGACNCTMSVSGREKSSTSYTVSGNTFTTDDGDVVDYCISGNNLTTRGSSSGGMTGQTKLHKI